MRFISALLQTYIFWSAFWGLAYFIHPSSSTWIMALFPPFGLYSASYFYKFTLLPILLSSVGTFFLIRRLRSELSKSLAPLIANLSFLVLFIISSQAYLSTLMHVQLTKLNPECTNYTPFFASLIFQESRGGHTTAFKSGKIYQWSFRDNSFYLNSRAEQYDFRLKICKS
jgi:hypothetical protein